MKHNSSSVSNQKLVTAVIGAGPAGLLFSIITQILCQQQQLEEHFKLFLFDKRETYVRTHRLRIEPKVYEAIAKELKHPGFDDIIQFLKDNQFKPAVNLLEEQLAKLAFSLGITKECLEIGLEEGQHSLADLQQFLMDRGSLSSDDSLTIVAADSVRSTIREWVRKKHQIVKQSHQYVVRLKIIGDNLPNHLNPVKQFRIAKLLGSLVDYRLNKNGYGEVDLFLEPKEFEQVMALGANIKHPIRITGDVLIGLKAPFFKKIVSFLLRGISGQFCELVLQSTFKLEHAYLKLLSFKSDEPDAQIFLVGDAAISLPFFRGMASLAACANQLARVHIDLILESLSDCQKFLNAGTKNFEDPERSWHYGLDILPGKIIKVKPIIYHGQQAFILLHRWLNLYGVHILTQEDSGKWHILYHMGPVFYSSAHRNYALLSEPALRYQQETSVIRKRELSIVNSRSKLIRGARELVRLSSMLPFPIQSWILGQPGLGIDSSSQDKLSLEFYFNLVIALIAIALFYNSLGMGSMLGGILTFSCLIAQIFGGILYFYTSDLTKVTSKLRWIWQFQILAMIISGWSFAWVISELWLKLWALTGWFLAGLAFIVGFYIFEHLERKGY